jgi:predicted AlkP superfamily pyrophosphatase or phosphodiesterase
LGRHEPDFITPENTPNLHALATRGTFFNNNHSFYITTTEVNGTVLATGVFPRRSGIMANLEYRPAIDLMRGVATDDFTTVLINDALTDGRHIAVPTVAGVGAEGRPHHCGRLHENDRAASRPRHGPHRRGPTLWLGRTYPIDFLKTVVQAQGKFPAYPKTDIFDIADARPNTAQNLWTTKALVNILWKDEIPAYSVLWLGDPDFSQHFTAPGSPTALAAIHDSDTHLGLALAELEKRGSSIPRMCS